MVLKPGQAAIGGGLEGNRRYFHCNHINGLELGCLLTSPKHSD